MAALIVDDGDHRHQGLSHFLQTYYPDVHVITDVSAIAITQDLVGETHPDPVSLNSPLTGENKTEHVSVRQDGDLLFVFVPPKKNDPDASDAVRYILKLMYPTNSEETIAQLQQAFELFLGKKQEEELEHKDISTAGVLTAHNNNAGKIILPTSEGLIVQAVAKIIRLESDNYYTTVVRKDLPNILLTKTLKDFEAALDPEEFLRVHNSHIISLAWLERFDKRDGGYVTMYDGSRVPVSRRRHHVLLERLQRYRHV